MEFTEAASVETLALEEAVSTVELHARTKKKEIQPDSQDEKFVFSSLTYTQGMTDQCKCRKTGGREMVHKRAGGKEERDGGICSGQRLTSPFSEMDE